MPLPEGYLPREGDVLVLHGTVKYPIDKEVDLPGRLAVWVELSGDYTPATLISGMLQDKRRIVLDSVAGIHRRSWREDEPVRVKGGTAFGTVVIQREDVVLVALDPESEIPKSAVGGCILIHCNALEPLPAFEVREGFVGETDADLRERVRAAARLEQGDDLSADDEEAIAGAAAGRLDVLARSYGLSRGNTPPPAPPPAIPEHPGIRKVPRFEASPPVERLAEHPEDRSLPVASEPDEETPL